MRHKKRDCLCEAHSALFVRFFSLGCESSQSRGHDNELVHPLELKLSWKGKLARRRFNFVCALSFMRFTGLLDRTLSNCSTERTFGPRDTWQGQQMALPERRSKAAHAQTANSSRDVPDRNAPRLQRKT